MLLAIGLACAFAGIFLCPAAAELAQPPEALLSTAERSRNVYDAARSSYWARANSGLRALTTAGARLVRSPADREAKWLAKKLVQLACAVYERDRLKTMRAANRITFWAAQQAVSYQLSTPTAVTLLEFYGREVQIAMEAGDPNELAKSVANLRQGWKAARPMIALRNVAAPLEKFDALIERLENPSPGDEPASLADVMLKSVDDMEKLFPE